MFKIFSLIILLIFLYILLKQERKSVKCSFLIYFSLLSIVLMSGLIYITSAYQLNDNPIDGGFKMQFNWVNVFLYLYLIPLFGLLGYKLVTFTNKSLKNIWIKITLLIAGFAVLAFAGYVLSFIFILIFYGFAP